MELSTASSSSAPTEKQKAVLEFLWSFQERLGRTPTGPEIARHFEFKDASSAYEHLRLLDRKGYVQITRSGRRTPLAVRLTDLAKNLLQITYPPVWLDPGRTAGRCDHRCGSRAALHRRPRPFP